MANSILQEEWRQVKGYEGKYLVSNHGRVCCIRQDRWDRHHGTYVPFYCWNIVNGFDNGHGYKVVAFRKDGKVKNYYIHRIVAEAFIPNPEGLPCVNHLDYNRSNNDISNLEWCTQTENMQWSLPNIKRGFRAKEQCRKTNTGEQYITKRRVKGKDIYRVIIRWKEYGYSKTLEEAIELRDKVLKGVYGIGEVDSTE